MVWQFSVACLVYGSYGALWMYRWKINVVTISPLRLLAICVTCSYLAGTVQGVVISWTIRWSGLPLSVGNLQEFQEKCHSDMGHDLAYWSPVSPLSVQQTLASVSNDISVTLH